MHTHAHTHTAHPYLIRAASDKNFLCSSIVEPFLRVCRNSVNDFRLLLI